MLKWLQSFFHPWQTIAQELTILRQLYELDLESHKPPIYRITEKPSKGDTTVSYAGEPEKKEKADIFDDVEDEEV